MDGVLCRTPEELFDLLLQDYWDFELIRRTHGRREATAADEEAVDLCRTPEELFDLLLQDYWDFELIRRTQGRREATAADEEAVDELCQPYLDWRKEALK